jgi:hypothetical protein
MKFCAYDVEGRTGDEGVLGVAIHSDLVSTYETDVDTAFNILREHARQKYILCSHNAEYDISVLFWQYNEQVELYYFNARFNRGVWVTDNGKTRCQIWDTLKLSAGLSLKEVGKSIGLPKYPTPQKLTGKDPNKYEWQCTKHQVWECETCYAIRDAEICYEYIRSYESFMGIYGLEPKRTLASAAVDVWQVLDSPGSVNLWGKELDTFARSGYFGGRVETFKLGNIQPCYTADVMSMYPAVMLNTPMPVAKYTRELVSTYLSAPTLDLEGMSECTVYIPDMYVPPLPVASQGKLYFPTGTVRGVWTHLELRAAMERGVRLITIHKCIYSSEVCFPFTNFVENMIQLRQMYMKDDDARQLTVKIILNSLYGRLGLSNEQDMEKRFLLPDGKSTNEYKGYDYKIIGGQVYLTKSNTREIFSKMANPLWAAYITAAARVKLLSYLEMQGSNLVYCDTDSVFSMAPIQGIGEGLGTLTKPDTYERANILGPKMYSLENNIGTSIYKAKGVRKDHAKEFLDTGTATFDAPIRPRQAMTRKIQAGVWVEVTKTWRHAPGKRHALNASWSDSDTGFSDTVPISFQLDAEEESAPLDPV